MQKFTVVVLSCALLFAVGACRPRQEAADQEWLRTAEKLVTSGHTRISTPSSRQADLLKQWAKAHGYGIAITQTQAGYRLELVKCSPATQRVTAPLAQSHRK